MAVYKCKMCGGSLEVAEGITVCECEYCGTQQTLPKTDNEQNLNMFNRANHFRQQCEFDKAAEIYEKMAARSEGDAELYWSLVLCRYGIEYVDDPLTKKKIATCHRTQFRSILDDPDYLTALEHADMMQKSVYEREAEYIDNVQKGILEISNKEEPFDVFICYKETDNNGRRTQDSVLAQELYYGLTQEGFKVFFSRITLESKLGTEYEPYIFAALNSSKVMVVVGTKPEYFNAVWVRNEWSRYLMLMQNDRSRTLIPAYKDMDPYDLPDDLSMFQAQDMSKLGFMQDIIRGIKKLIRTEPENEPVKTQPVQQNSSVSSAGKNLENLLKRGFICLEDKKWKEADQFFEQVLDENVEEHRAYIGKLCAEMNVPNEESLTKLQSDFTNSDNYRKACRFGGKDVEKRLFEYNQKGLYERAVSTFENAQTEDDCIEAQKIFIALGEYKDSDQKVIKCNKKIDEIKQNNYSCAIRLMKSAFEESIYKNAISKLSAAKGIFANLKGFDNAIQMELKCSNKQNELIQQQCDLAIEQIKNATTRNDCINIFREYSYLSIYDRTKYENIEEEKAKALKLFFDKEEKEKKERIQKEEKDRRERIKNEQIENIYKEAEKAYQRDGEYSIENAIKQFQSISEYKDSKQMIEKCKNRLKELQKEKKKKGITATLEAICILIAMIIVLWVIFSPFLKPFLETFLEGIKTILN